MEDEDPPVGVKEGVRLRAKPRGMTEFEGDLPGTGGNKRCVGMEGSGEAVEGEEVKGERRGELKEYGATKGGREEGGAIEEKGKLV